MKLCADFPQPWEDDAAGVDLHRYIGALAAVHSTAHHPLGEGDRHPSLALLDEDDGDQQGDGQGEDDAELEVAALGSYGGAPGRHPGHHVGEDQDRHALTDPALGDQLTQPHHERGAGGHGEHDQQHPRHREVGDQVDVEPAAGAEEPAATVVEDERQAGRLHDRQGDGEVPGRLGQFLLAGGTFLPPLLELRDHDHQQLDDDLGRDVGHDPEPEHREAGQRAPGEEAEEAQHSALGRRRLQGLQGLEVDTW